MAKQGNPKYWSDEELVAEFKSAIVKTEELVHMGGYERGLRPDPRDVANAKAREIEAVLIERIATLRRCDMRKFL